MHIQRTNILRPINRTYWLDHSPLRNTRVIPVQRMEVRAQGRGTITHPWAYIVFLVNNSWHLSPITEFVFYLGWVYSNAVHSFVFFFLISFHFFPFLRTAEKVLDGRDSAKRPNSQVYSRQGRIMQLLLTI